MGLFSFLGGFSRRKRFIERQMRRLQEERQRSGSSASWEQQAGAREKEMVHVYAEMFDKLLNENPEMLARIERELLPYR